MVQNAGRDVRSPREHYETARQLHREGRLAEAERHYRAVLAAHPHHPDTLQGLGVICLSTGRPAEGADLLVRATKALPHDAVLRNNLGQALAQLGRHAEARAHLERALVLAPERGEIHTNLGNVLLAQGHREDALAAFHAAIVRNPRLVEPYNNIGNVLMAAGRYAEAAGQFERVMALAPDFAVARYNLAVALAHLERHAEAAAHYETVLAQTPDNAAAHSGLGNSLNALGRYEEALAAFEKALVLMPGMAAAHCGMGAVLQNLGRLAEARKAFEQAIALEPGLPSYHRALIETRRLAKDDPEFAALESLVRGEARLPEGERIELDFACAKAYDDIGDHARAFRHMQSGNARKRAQVAYDEKAEMEAMAAMARTFTADSMAMFAGAGAASDVPVFVVGMPRSGTSLIEQMLASHPRVFGAGELKSFEEAFAGNSTAVAACASLSREGLACTGKDYLERVRIMAPDAVRIVDKMPGNFLYAGAIHAALPGARIIHAMRDPRDTCFSIYARQFVNGMGYAFDQGELGRFYKAYEKLMAHWRRVLPPAAMIEVQYETLVRNFEAEARRIVEFCGLEWDARCLAFHETERPVRTSSVYQVREPLYRRAIGRWEPYKEWLGPLLETLSS